jgi:hypothetical protein
MFQDLTSVLCVLNHFIDSNIKLVISVLILERSLILVPFLVVPSDSLVQMNSLVMFVFILQIRKECARQKPKSSNTIHPPFVLYLLHLLSLPVHISHKTQSSLPIHLPLSFLPPP